MGQVLVLGLVAGGIYAMFAVGVVLVYRGTGVLTFAQGEIGTVGLYVGAFLSTDHGLPWAVGALGALVVATAIGVLFEILIVRRMVNADKVSIAVATVGLVLFLVAFEFHCSGRAHGSCAVRSRAASPSPAWW